MDIITLFNHLEKYGNTVCKASEVNNKNSNVHVFIEKYGIQKVKTIKKGSKGENNVVILSVDKTLMTNKVKEDVLRMANKEYSQEVLSTIMYGDDLCN